MAKPEPTPQFPNNYLRPVGSTSIMYAHSSHRANLPSPTPSPRPRTPHTRMRVIARLVLCFMRARGLFARGTGARPSLETRVGSITVCCLHGPPLSPPTRRFLGARACAPTRPCILPERSSKRERMCGHGVHLLLRTVCMHVRGQRSCGVCRHDRPRCARVRPHARVPPPLYPHVRPQRVPRRTCPPRRLRCLLSARQGAGLY